jgi:CubicO group peptidase (beta-lactamase class C family)
VAPSEPETTTPLPAVSARVVDQGPSVPWPGTSWPRADGAPSAALEAVVEEAFADPELTETQAVVVVQGGRVLVERYGGAVPFFDRPSEPVGPETRLLSWSMAKSMLHFIVGTLVDEGRLDPDQPAPVPEWRDPTDPRSRILLRDLLAMRDGLAFVEHYTVGEPSDVIEMLFGAGQDDVAGFTAAKALAHEPGTHFNYSSGTSNVISRIVADHVGYGDDYRRYLEDRLFGPLGMSSATATFDERGVWVASSYVHATALDFARFGLLYLRGGAWNGRQLVSRAWTETAQRPLSRDPENGDLYSWQWWVTGDEWGTYWASGYEGQQISVVPALDAVLVRLGKTPEDRERNHFAWRRRVLSALSA